MICMLVGPVSPRVHGQNSYWSISSLNLPNNLVFISYATRTCCCLLTDAMMLVCTESISCSRSSLRAQLQDAVMSDNGEEAVRQRHFVAVDVGGPSFSEEQQHGKRYATPPSYQS